MPNPLETRPIDTTNLMKGISAISMDTRDQNRKKVIQNEIMEAMQSDDPMAIPSMIAKYPQAGAGLEKAFNFKDDRTKRTMAEGVFPVLSELDAFRQSGDPIPAPVLARAKEQLVNTAVAVAQKGGDPQNFARIIESLDNPELMPNALRALNNVAYMADPEQYNDFYGTASTRLSKNGVGARQMFENGTVQMAMNNGGSRVFLPDGTEVFGEEASEALKKANEFEVQKAVTQAGSKAEAVNEADLRKQIKESEQKERRDNVQQATNEAYRMDKNIRLLDRATDLLDQGAVTGWLANKFPSWTQATIDLENIGTQLGLEVIAGVTFGALSAGEMKVAMDTAMPRDMSPEGLRNWTTKKATAMKKLQRELVDFAEYLQDGGTKLEWMKKKRDQREAMNAKKADELLKKEGRY